MGEDRHRALGLHDSLNLLDSVKESVFIDSDFHEASLLLGGATNFAWFSIIPKTCQKVIVRHMSGGMKETTTCKVRWTPL
jgi:hypothetical protein